MWEKGKGKQRNSAKKERKEERKKMKDRKV